jgi:hypothetical protein
MKRTCQEWLMAALIICSIAIFIHGCTTIGGTVHSEPNDQSGYRHPPVAKNGPPAHAPAHGYRAKHRYRYYPSCSVYFDIGRSVYFYLGSVEVEMDTDKPYLQHKYHKQKYPPGQLKKKKSKKWVKSK